MLADNLICRNLQKRYFCVFINLILGEIETKEYLLEALDENLRKKMRFNRDGPRFADWPYYRTIFISSDNK